MNAEKGMIFKNTAIFILTSVLFIFIMGGAIYCYFKINNGTVPAILIFLPGLLLLGYMVLWNPFSITASRMGITQNSILGAWNFKWNRIKGWNIVNFGDGKRTIWFRTGANIYKITPDIFRKNDVENLAAYFEKYCGKSLEGDDRLGSSISHWF